MPIRLPETLPAYRILEKEGVMVMGEDTANRQDIRPLRLGLLNLMPTKEATETQFARLIGATPLQIELDLIRMTDHISKNTSPEHIESHYIPFQEIKQNKYDGLIITGAPVELLDYKDVTYIDELHQIFEWTRTHVHSTMAVCWGGMAMVNYFHNVPKHELPAKAFGCFRHQNLDKASPYLRGFSDDFVIPVSRWTEIRREDLEGKALEILIDSKDVGVCMVEDKTLRALYFFNHLEYDTHTLKGEYDRDIRAKREINIPINYYPENDPTRSPENRWRSHAHLLYGNWINQIYQTTPYNIETIGL